MLFINKTLSSLIGNGGKSSVLEFNFLPFSHFQDWKFSEKQYDFGQVMETLWPQFSHL